MQQKPNSQQKSKNLKSLKNSSNSSNKLKININKEYTPRRVSNYSKRNVPNHSSKVYFGCTRRAGTFYSNNPLAGKYKHVTGEAIDGIINSTEKQKKKQKKKSK